MNKNELKRLAGALLTLTLGAVGGCNFWVSTAPLDGAQADDAATDTGGVSDVDDTDLDTDAPTDTRADVEPDDTNLIPDSDASDPGDVDTDAGPDTDPVDTDVTDADTAPDVELGPPLNACGGHEILAHEGVTAAPGDGCVCGGTLYCNGSDALHCSGDTRRNACGGCGPLAVMPGETCCGGGVYACDASGGVACVGSQVNPCGGCETLEVPATCETLGHSIYCDGPEQFACSASYVNTCGTTIDLIYHGAPAAPGERCGDTCGWGWLQCDATAPGGLTCVGAPPPNACGGCGPLPGSEGDLCGCGGAWRCDGTALVCDGDQTNLCGGCAELSANPGELCDDGVLVCAGAEATTCDDGTLAACGGASTTAIPGTSCGTCGTNVCADSGVTCEELTCVAPAYALILEGGPVVRFEGTYVGSPGTQTRTLRNLGSVDLSGLTATAPGAPFEVESSCGGSLVAGGACELEFAYAPTVVETHASRTVVSYSGGELPIDLIGVARDPGELQWLDTATITMEAVVGESTTAEVTVVNDGASEATGLSFVAPPTAPFGFVVPPLDACGVLSAGASCDATLRFAPESVGSAHQSIVLGYTQNGAGAFLLLDLEGRGLAPALLAASPTRIDFGAVIGSQSRTLTLTNNGDAAATDIVLETTSPYTLTANTCDATLTAGSSCQATVQFAPASTGTAVRALVITYDDGTPDEQVLNVQLTGSYSSH